MYFTKFAVLLTLTVLGSAAIECGISGETLLDAPTPKLDCSSIIVKESEGVLNWLGNVTFIVPTSTTVDGWSMTITFDQKFTGLGVRA
jgi:hypothetical protein